MNIYDAILICAVSAYASFFMLRLNKFQSHLEAQDAVIEELKKELNEERKKRRDEDYSIRHDFENIMSGRVSCRATEK